MWQLFLISDLAVTSWKVESSEPVVHVVFTLSLTFHCISLTDVLTSRCVGEGRSSVEC